jgi:O-antigen/teichoic acid export membrane protein
VGKHRAETVLGRQIGNGLTWSFVNNLLNRLGSLAAGVVLARILVPADYGVFAVALVVLNAILSINELGVSLAVVRWPGRLDRIAPTVTTMSLVFSSFLFVTCFAAAPVVASALDAPSATWLIRVLCLCVVADGAASVSAALITREFRQRLRLVIDIASFVAGSGLSVVLAVMGFGAWSMVWGFLASNVLASVFSVVAAPRWYPPGWDRGAARELLAFGAPLAGSSLLMFFMLNTDYVIVGHLLGASALGVYLLAFNLSAWPAGMVSAPVRRVSLAAFSRLAEQPMRIGESFARAAALLLAVALPMSVLLAAYGRPLIAFVYGAKWSAAAPVLQLLCVLGVVRILTELAYDFLVALGRTRPNLWLQVLWTACLGPALVIGARADGIVGVAAGHAVVAVGIVVPAYALALRNAGVRTPQLVTGLVRPIVGGIVVVGSAAVVLRVVDGDLPQLALGGVVALPLYLAVVRPDRLRSQRSVSVAAG